MIIMWIMLAIISAVTAGFSVIFGKIGTGCKNSYIVALVNCTAMLLTMLLAVIFFGSFADLSKMTADCWKLAVASGVVQGFSWLAFFMALKAGSVNGVMVLDKTNVIVAMILAYLILDEMISMYMVAGTVLLIIGTALMAGSVHSKRISLNKESRWILWGIVSPALQAVSTILVKLDTSGVDSTLTSLIRTIATVLTLIFCILMQKTKLSLKHIDRKSWIGMISCGICMGASYLFMYRALSLGSATVVTAIVKSSFLVTTAAAYIILGEKLTDKGKIGFITVFAGTVMFLI